MKVAGARANHLLRFFECARPIIQGPAAQMAWLKVPSTTILMNHARHFNA